MLSGNLNVEQTKTYLDWKIVEKQAEACANYYKAKHFKPTAIFGVSRGGLIPATLVAHHLGVQYVDSIQIRTCRTSEQSSKSVIDTAGRDLLVRYNEPEFLVIDDLYDSGSTTKLIKTIAPNIRVACLFTKTTLKEPECSHIDWVGQKLQTNRWVVFPWEI